MQRSCSVLLPEHTYVVPFQDLSVAAIQMNPILQASKAKMKT